MKTKIIKSAIKAVLLIIVFITTLIVASKIMNKDRENITMEQVNAGFPVMAMVRENVTYNELHGYALRQDIRSVKDSLTILGENRETGYYINTYGNNIAGLGYELRTADGLGLIEKGNITDYSLSGYHISGTLKLKDLLSENEIYSLAFIITMEDGRDIYYYTEAIWNDGMSVDEKLAFIQDFHDRLFSKDASLEIKKYLETNSALNDNSTFANVNIHSNFYQITYGELNVSQLEEPMIYLKDISDSMITALVKYIVFTGDEQEDRTYYYATEYYRVKMGKERMYLIDYERHMEQVPKTDKLCQNDKIVLGITDADVDYEESEDGNTVAFIAGGSLFSYQASTNKLTQVFAFTGSSDFDERAIYDAHTIKILDIEESGSIEFAVCGYMNSGRREGHVGIEVFRFDSKLNTIEEMIYIPYSKSPEMLEAEMNTLLYMNRGRRMYITLENKVYCVDLNNKSYTTRHDVENDDTLVTSSNHKVLISTRLYDESRLAQSLVLTNLSTENDTEIQAVKDDAIKPLGFIGNDVIYGIAHIEDITEDSSGRIFYPMYQVIICDEAGNLLKRYEYEGYYVTELEQRENQIIMSRVSKDGNGYFRDAESDCITVEMDSNQQSVSNATTVVDIYETYVQLQLPKKVDSASLKIVIPKEIVAESNCELEIDLTEIQRYYAYDAYGLAGIYNLASNAVNRAEEQAGWVYDTNGTLVWKKINKKTKNQIMAITEEQASDERSSLAVCLDAMLKKEGIIRNSDYLLAQGSSVLELLRDNMEGFLVLDLKDCSLDSVLYYVSEEVPVLVMTGSGSAVLIVGYNDSQIVMLNPEKGIIEKLSIGDAQSFFEERGNEFITYAKE